jgi:peptidoglycan/xylan/chitin deacetylase (PgdA/CDA1 family)
LQHSDSKIATTHITLMHGLRIDRIATIYLFSPLQQRSPRVELPSVPILMYHSISRIRERRVHPYYRIQTMPEVFAQHMAFLRDHGYRTLNLQQTVDILMGKSTPTGRPVVLTFDDGYANFYREAFPVMAQHGFTATVYLPTGYIGSSPMLFQGQECLTWNEVRELQAHGITFGSHTVTHPQLQLLSRTEIEHELRDSKATIEDAVGVSVSSFAYPFAFPQADTSFCHCVRETLEGCGYKNGVCTIIGSASTSDDVFFLRRLPANSADDRALFRSKLEGGYDWVGKIQAGFKKARLVSCFSSAAESRFQPVSR